MTVEIHVCLITLPRQACALVRSQALVMSEHRLDCFTQLVSKPFVLHTCLDNVLHRDGEERRGNAILLWPEGCLVMVHFPTLEGTRSAPSKKLDHQVKTLSKNPVESYSTLKWPDQEPSRVHTILDEARKLGYGSFATLPGLNSSFVSRRDFPQIVHQWTQPLIPTVREAQTNQ